MYLTAKGYNDEIKCATNRGHSFITISEAIFLYENYRRGTFGRWNLNASNLIQYVWWHEESVTFTSMYSSIKPIRKNYSRKRVRIFIHENPIAFIFFK